MVNFCPIAQGLRQLNCSHSKKTTMTEPAENRRPSVSIIIPTLNEEETIARTLAALACVRGSSEIIVVDGGSDDLTRELAHKSRARVIISGCGRGIQMHEGAQFAGGQILLFLHADTTVPPDAVERIIEVLKADPVAVGGNFEISFDGDSRAARLMTWLYPKLGKIGLCYGDSGIFVRASVYSGAGGFNPFPIFEDLDLVYRLRRRGRMVHLPVTVVTSSRRFQGRSFVLTFARWSILQALYWIGISPRVLHQLYAPVRNARTRSVEGFQSVVKRSR